MPMLKNIFLCLILIEYVLMNKTYIGLSTVLQLKNTKMANRMYHNTCKSMGRVLIRCGYRKRL